MNTPYRIGIDFGGTKIATILLASNGDVISEKRFSTHRNSYEKTILSICDIVREIESDLDHKAHVGIGIPGSISPGTGLVQNGNSTWLNGQPLLRDLIEALERDVRIENDANCFALSEALEGAGKGARSVFGVIIGTGCGGGVVIDGKLMSGPHSIGGEWGHIPLPWITREELGARSCWCGQNDCMETWVSGPGMSADHALENGVELEAVKIAELAADGDPKSIETINRYISRLGRGLAGIINILDPNVIVFGGGLSNIEALYDQLPAAIEPYIFADHFNVALRRPKFGDASGVRGAAHLWP